MILFCGSPLVLSLLTQESHQIDLPLLTTERESKKMLTCKVSCSWIKTKVRAIWYPIGNWCCILREEGAIHTGTMTLLAARMQNWFDLEYWLYWSVGILNLDWIFKVSSLAQLVRLWARFSSASTRRVKWAGYWLCYHPASLPNLFVRCCDCYVQVMSDHKRSRILTLFIVP